ncbi:MAG: hypothetical protein RMM17_08425 [Acidobacteriota bacterium]|nr:hypothetical protein [Blastocatellia bacterium]MDW8412692.1 hypothetical protein [Acidobacteriota bacterium]
MMQESLYAAVGLGFVLGLRHALDTDHVVAVSTIVSEQTDWYRAGLVGAIWGLGHTASLFLMAILVLVFKLAISDLLATLLELLVALMLVGLGLDLLLVLYGKRKQRQFTSKRPFFVGMIHGLAGSAALMLIVLAAIPSPLAGLIYVIVFGLGSIGGMVLMAILMSLPMIFSLKHAASLAHRFKIAIGILSMSFGLLLALELLVT